MTLRGFTQTMRLGLWSWRGFVNENLLDHIPNHNGNNIQKGDQMPNWAKVIIFSVVMLYMVVNESERIETREELNMTTKIHKQWAEEFSYKLREFDGQYKNHIHRYYDGKIAPHIVEVERSKR